MKNTRKNVEQDADGQWWYRYGDGHRARLRPRVCMNCGEDFLAYASHSETHCSRLCARTCTRNHEDGSEELLQPHWKVDRAGPNSARWKSGTTMRKGYVWVWKPDHPSI